MVANSLSFSYVIHRCYKEPVTVSYIAFVADNSCLAADNLPWEANNLRLADYSYLADAI